MVSDKDTLGQDAPAIERLMKEKGASEVYEKEESSENVF